METIRVCNLRCFADTTPIEIKPINLLVGANSSGKSSFLRLFPLLRQSMEMRTLSGLVLNEGDVNFGFFNEALHREADPEELKLEFGFTLKSGIYQGRLVNSFLIEPTHTVLELTYAKRSKDHHYPYLREVRITINDENISDSIEIKAAEDGKIENFRVNEYQANGETAQLRLRVSRGIVPSLIRVLDTKDYDDSLGVDEITDIHPFDQKFIDESNSIFHGRTSTETRLNLFRSIQIGSAQKMLTAMKEIKGASYWGQHSQQWTLESPKFLKLRNLLLAKITGPLLSAMNLQIGELSRSVFYYKPVRSSVERDYVSRDVQVNSVDASGVNVALVLSSLGRSALEKFREWTRLHFGFEVYPQSVSDGARIALRMRENQSGADFNLADMGFGFSQMLPFLVQIWNLIEYEPTRGRSRFASGYDKSRLAMQRSFLIAIEQPELHLHPALQAKLADLFVNMVRISSDKNLPVRFVLETHSPTIIEQIGYLIEIGKIPASDVQVLLFEKNVDNQSANTSSIRPAIFDDGGVLKDWPFGFLAAPPNQFPQRVEKTSV